MFNQSNWWKSPQENLKVIAKKFHFDLVTMFLTLLFVMGGEWAFYSIVMGKKIDKDLLDLLGFTATTMGLVFTAANIHDQQHHNKLVKSSEYTKAWYGTEISTIVHTIIRNIKQQEFTTNNLDTKEDCHESEELKLLALKSMVGGLGILAERQTKVLKRLLENKKENDEVDRILSFFEQMGQDVKLGVADEEYLKDFFYGIVINYYEIFRKYIEYYQHQEQTKKIYCNFVYLAQTWEKKGSPPELPLICERRLIITPEDKCLKEKFKGGSGWGF